MKFILQIISFSLMSVLPVVKGYSQHEVAIKYENTTQAGHFGFWFRTISVDPGPGWKGYYLPQGSYGFSLTSINGISLNNRVHLGVGLSYANYAKINGMMYFWDVRVDVLKKKITPVLYMNAGSSRFWNQYSGGTKTELFELGLAGRCRLQKRQSMQVSFGFLGMQQLAFYTSKLAYSF